MDKPSIECAKNGPYLAKHLPLLKDAKGTEHPTKPVTALCRCGASKNKPFCDGTHAKIGFTDDKQEGRLADKRDNYAGKQITIHDNRGICAHAGFCTDRLNTVWKMGTEPWIDPDGAPVEKILEVIKACPSGALSYTRDGVEHRDNESSPLVFIAPNGPYAIKGGIDLPGVPKGEGASNEHYDLCRCGDSKNKPFCDGSHWYKKFDENAPDAKVSPRKS